MGGPGGRGRGGRGGESFGLEEVSEGEGAEPSPAAEEKITTAGERFEVGQTGVVSGIHGQGDAAGQSVEVEKLVGVKQQVAEVGQRGGLGGERAGRCNIGANAMPVRGVIFEEIRILE